MDLIIKAAHLTVKEVVALSGESQSIFFVGEENKIKREIKTLQADGREPAKVSGLCIYANSYW